MGKELVFDNGKMKVWYYDEWKIVHHNFVDLTYGQDLEDGFNKGLEVMKEHGAIKWLGEEGKTPVLRKEDLEWTAINWRPRMLDLGWKYWAVVSSQKASGKLFIEKLIKTYKDLGVTLKMFEDVDAALNWLKEQG